MIHSITFGISDANEWENARRWLVGHRKRMRLTQAVVAERMGTTQGEVSRLERGVADPYVSTIARYLRALELGGRFGSEPR